MTIYQLPAAPRDFEDVSLFEGEPVPFGQPWRTQKQRSFRPGHVRFGWLPDALWLYGEMEGHGTTTAQHNNEQLWILGDVLELFLGYADSEEYLELHTAPNGLILQMRFPDAAAIRALRSPHHGTLPDFVAGCGWQAQTRNDANGWQVLGRVPLSLSPGRKLHLSCGRYDYGSGKDVISNTGPLTKSDFHRRQDWHRAVLAEGSPPAVNGHKTGAVKVTK